MVKSTQIARLDGTSISSRLSTTPRTLTLHLHRADARRICRRRTGSQRPPRVSVTNDVSSDDPNIPQVESELAEVKGQAKLVFRRLNRNSATEAAVESGRYIL